MSRALTASILLAGLLTIGCVPPAPIPFNPSFSPEVPATRWEHGKARLSQEKDGITLVATFLEGGPGALLFEVEVQNRSGAPFVLTPEQLNIDLFMASQPAPMLLRTERAVDPERQIELLARSAHALERQRQVDQAVAGNLAIFALAVDVASAVDNSQKPAQERHATAPISPVVIHDLAHSEAQADLTHTIRLANLKDTREPWEQACLRRTTVDDGQGVRGRVVFHLDATRCDRLVLRVPAGPVTFEVPYRPVQR